MTKFVQGQNNFSTGQVDQKFQGRMEVAEYFNGVEEMQNFIVQRHGGAFKRPGSKFVKDLEGVLDYNIGDAGTKLSGGQKQRLSIARAVLKSPPIMVLDEATSALDTESERLVQVALENMMKNRTSIVIAHRLSTIQKANNIVVMKKGKIVEQGKHEELLDKKSEYFKLVSMQSLA